MAWGETSRIVEDAAIAALEQLLSDGRKDKFSGSDIYHKALGQGGVEVTENVFKSYLSNLSGNSESRIVKDVGQHGYYLKPLEETLDVLVEDKTDEEDGANLPDRERRKEKERVLYPLLKTWLQSRGYRAKDTSAMKAMGRWGNPDITGIKVEESLGTNDIELVSIEAKVTNDAYRYDFFEAVSHKRFANRVYYAFAATTNFLRENNEELRYYSELYGVGIVVLALDSHVFEQLKNGCLESIDTDGVDVYELFSAPHEHRLLRWQKKYLASVGIVDGQTLWGWGDA